jgi:RNA polymerase sigma-70 factor (ECF subfamily)
MSIAVRHPERDLAAGQAAATLAALDETLIAQIAAGNRLAMRNLYQRHQLRVYRFVLRIVGDRSLAEDVISEVFFDVWKKAGRFEGRSSVSTWLLGVARHKALTAVASKPRPAEPIDGVAAMNVADSAADPDAAILSNERGALLRRCLGELSAEHREIIDLVYYQEKSIKEIADLLAIPDSTVKTRMFYARKRLAVLIEAAGADRSEAPSLH